MSDSVRVDGLRDLQRALRGISKEAAKELRLALREIAAEIAKSASAKVPRRSGRAASSYKPRASGAGAAIAFGGTRAPYAPWLDFGGRVGVNKSVSRPFIREGRYLFPTIGENSDEIKNRADEAMKRLADKYGFDQRGSN